MKKILFLIFIAFFNLQNLFANEVNSYYSTKFDKFITEFLNKGGSIETAKILSETFTKLSKSEKIEDFNKFKLKLLPVFFSLKMKDQKILWQIYTNKKPQINQHIKLSKNINS